MRKEFKGRVLLSGLTALAMLLCSFPVAYAEAMDTESFVEEITTEALPAVEEKAESVQEPAPKPEPVSEPVCVPESDAKPASEPVCVPESSTEPAPEPVCVPESTVEPAPEPVCVPEPIAEPASAVMEEKTAAEPEPVWIPKDDHAEEFKPENEKTPVPEAAEEEPEGGLCVFDDDDAGSVSAELLGRSDSLSEDQKARFAGTVDIEMKSGEIAFGQDVTLVAKVSGAEALNYSLVWEANDGDGSGWHSVGAGSEYTFLLTRGNADREYRVLLFAVD